LSGAVKMQAKQPAVKAQKVREQRERFERSG
jgi:hypothetical protein